jgi:hypothetical protein
MRIKTEQVENSNTKEQLLEIIQQLREELIKEREISAQELERTITDIKTSP